MDISGKLIVITGGGSRMGLEMAKSFANDGARVVITGRNQSKLELAAEQHANITPFVCDVSKDEDMISLRDAMEKQGGVDFLINSKWNDASFSLSAKRLNANTPSNFQTPASLMKLICWTRRAK